MRSKNARAIDTQERSWLARVKALPCSCCNALGPSDAHHIIQGDHFSTIPLCHDGCHQGKGGVHGDGSLFRVHKTNEMKCLNKTIRALDKGATTFADSPHRQTRTVPRETSGDLPRIVPRPWA